MILSAAALVALWKFTITNREARYLLLSYHSFETTAELSSLLGRPDHIQEHKEGDAVYMYSVRSAPWSTVRWYWVYKGQVFGSSGGRSIGFFYQPLADQPRTEREASIAKDQLARLTKGLRHQDTSKE